MSPNLIVTDMKTYGVVQIVFALTTLLISQTALHLNAAESDVDLFAPNRVMQVEVKMDPDDWQAMRIEHRSPEVGNWSKMAESPYKYYRASVRIDGQQFDSVGIRKKGFIGSAISTRPSLKINLDKYVKDQELGGMDLLTFNNNNQDPTQAQQFLVYGLMNKAGAMAPRVGFARIIVNGEDLGVYSHVEAIRKPFVKRHFGNSKGDLYEGLAGDFTERSLPRIIHKWGDDEEMLGMTSLNELINQPGPLDVSRLGEVLDLDSFFTLWATEVLTGHWDGYAGNRNNWHLYRDPGSGRYYMIPWGADSAFPDPRPNTGVTLPKSVFARGRICQRLWELPAMRVRYQAEMQRLLDTVWNEERILSELDRILQMTEGYRTIDEDAVDVVSQRIRSFVGRRREDIETEFSGSIPEFPRRRQRASAPGVPPKQMNISGTFSTTMGGTMERAREITNAVTVYGIGDAGMSFSIDGEMHTRFNRFNARAGTATGNRQGYPVIRIDAADQDGEKKWTLTMTVDPHQLQAGVNVLESNLFSTWSVLAQGDPGTPGQQVNVWGVGGELRLDEFSMEPGAEISGSFDLTARAFRESNRN